MALPTPIQRVLVPRRVVRDGQTLSVEIQLLLALKKLVRMPVAETLPVEDGRRELLLQLLMVGGRQHVGALRDLTVDGAEGPLAARLYIPTERTGADPAPTLLFFHGGGWMYGDLESHDAACRFVAEHSGVQLLAIDYRLSPEHRFPAAVEDCRAAYRWLVEHADEVNADPTRLAVGGDSAGGNLTAVTAVWAAEQGLPLAFQLLIYPGTSFAEPKSVSRRTLGTGFFLTDAFMGGAEAAYFGDADGAADDRARSRSNPDASPLLRENLPENLAPAHVATAGFDPLRDEGEAYAELLEKNGVAVTRTRYPGLIHGFLNIVGAGKDAPAAVRDIAATLRTALS